MPDVQILQVVSDAWVLAGAVGVLGCLHALCFVFLATRVSRGHAQRVELRCGRYLHLKVESDKETVEEPAKPEAGGPSG